jgi:hypothetical protein
MAQQFWASAPVDVPAAIVFAAIFAAEESLSGLALVAAAFPRRSRPDALYREGGPNLGLHVAPGSLARHPHWAVGTCLVRWPPWTRIQTKQAPAPISSPPSLFFLILQYGYAFLHLLHGPLCQFFFTVHISLIKSGRALRDRI